MTELNWARNVIKSVYPDAMQNKGIDLNHNKKIDQNEAISEDSNQAFLNFLSRNENALSKQISFIDYGKELRPTNKIHELFYLESAFFPPEQVKAAYNKLSNLISAIKFEISKPENANLKDVGKIQLAYKVMKEKGYSFDKPQGEKQAFIENLNTKELDCDTSAFVAITLADEVGINVDLISVSNNLAHVYLNIKDVILDYGEIITKEQISKEYKILPDDMSKIFKPIKGNEISYLFYNNIGNLAMYKDDYKKALAIYDQVLTINPNATEALMNRGLIRSNQESIKSAIKDYEFILGIKSNHYRALIALADCYAELGQKPKANAYLQKAMQVNPNDYRVYYVQSKIAENPKDALKYLDQAYNAGLPKTTSEIMYQIKLNKISMNFSQTIKENNLTYD